jgi:hypothetical protein
MATSFETTSVRRTQNRYVTLSFFARAGANYSAASGFLRAFITTGTGTDGRLITGSFTSPTTLVDSNNVLTTSWKRFTVTTSAPVGSTVTQMGVTFQFTPVGTAGAADYYDITGVQLEAASAPSDFEFEPLGAVLLKCQRYYAASLSGSDFFANNYFWGAGPNGLYNFGIGVAFPRSMRIVPALSVNFVNFDNALNGGQTVHASGFTQYYRNANGSFPYCGWRATYTASAEL